MSSTSCSVERADRRLQAQHADQVLEVGVGEIAARRKDVLLDVQHVEVRAHADLLAEDVRLQRDFRRHHRLLERLDRRRRAVDAGESGLRLVTARRAAPLRGPAASLSCSAMASRTRELTKPPV